MIKQNKPPRQDIRIDYVEMAKNLFFDCDETGKQKNTFRSISTKIYKDTGKDIHFSTIAKWEKKYNWSKLLQDAKNLGLYKAQQEEIEEQKKILSGAVSEEVIKQAKAEEQSKHYKALDNVFSMGYNELARRWKEEPERFKEVRTGELLDLMTKTLDRLKGFFGDDDKKDIIIKIGFNENRD